MTTWTASDAQLGAWGLLSEDYNPLHFDASFAIERGFVGRIVFGALALARIESEVRQKLPNEGLAIDVRFRIPMPVGEEMSVEFDLRSGRVAVRIAGAGADAVVGAVQILEAD